MWITSSLTRPKTAAAQVLAAVALSIVESRDAHAWMQDLPWPWETVVWSGVQERAAQPSPDELADPKCISIALEDDCRSLTLCAGSTPLDDGSEVLTHSATCELADPDLLTCVADFVDQVWSDSASRRGSD